MSGQVEAQLAIALLQLAFFAGGAYAVLKQIQRTAAELRRDVNGLGARVRNLDRETVVMLMLIAPEEKRHRIAGILLGRGRD